MVFRLLPPLKIASTSWPSVSKGVRRGLIYTAFRALSSDLCSILYIFFMASEILLSLMHMQNNHITYSRRVDIRNPENSPHGTKTDENPEQRCREVRENPRYIKQELSSLEKPRFVLTGSAGKLDGFASGCDRLGWRFRSDAIVCCQQTSLRLYSATDYRLDWRSSAAESAPESLSEVAPCIQLKHI